MINRNKPWWSEDYEFFGSFYIEGDDSKEGYLSSKKQSLSDRTKSEVDGIVRLLSPVANTTILDCPCGYGRHSIELARRGFKVIGSDINTVHLKKAKEDAEKSAVSIVFRKENMLDLSYKSEFDIVINMFYSFGFFDSDEENEKVLLNFYRALKVGGKFVMHTDVNIPRIVTGKYKQDEIRELESRRMLRITDNYDPETKRINGTWTITDNGHEEKKDYSVRVYGKEEFELLCKKVGFSSVMIYADWEGNPYSEDAEDMIVVAIK